MTINRFDPFRDLSRFFGDVYLRDEELTSRGSWVPPVDIYETAGHDLVIKAELPDVNREDVEVTVENNTLTLKGTKSLPADVKEEQFRRVERRYGSFARSFTRAAKPACSQRSWPTRRVIAARMRAISSDNPPGQVSTVSSEAFAAWPSRLAK